MMKLLIDISNMSNLYTNSGQIALNYGKTISSINTNLEIHFLIPKNFNIKLGNKKIEYHTEKDIKKYLKNNSFDLWHCLGQSPKIIPDKDTPLILTISDLRLFNKKKSFLAKFKTNKLQKLIKRASFVCFTSKFIQDIALENYNIDSEKSIVIYNGVNTSKTENNNVNISLNKGNFFFCIGPILAQKNFLSLIPLLNEYPRTYLVISGTAKGSYYKLLRSFAKKHELEDRLIFTGIIDEEQKTWLYRNCKAFLLPSLCEYSGTAVLEALRNGRPTIISKLCCLPEIGSKYAYYFDSFETEEMKELINNSILDFDSNPTKRISQIEYAKNFDWLQNCNKYLEIYSQVLESRKTKEDL